MPRATFAWAMATMPSFQNLMQAYVQAFLKQVLVAGGFVAQQLGTGQGDGLL
jgi:hypothetical protein